jgi:hypothetical protein
MPQNLLCLLVFLGFFLISGFVIPSICGFLCFPEAFWISGGAMPSHLLCLGGVVGFPEVLLDFWFCNAFKSVVGVGCRCLPEVFVDSLFLFFFGGGVPVFLKFSDIFD